MKGRVRTDQAPNLGTPLPFFGAAQLFAVSGLLMLSLNARTVVQGVLTGPVVVSMVHLFTLGTITMAMMGALYQWLPVIGAGTTVPAWRARLQFVLFTAGVLGFVPGVATGRTPLLVMGGVALESGLVLFLYNIAAMGLLRHLRARDSALVAAGLAALAATAILGGLMAGRLAAGTAIPNSWLAAHLVLGPGAFAGLVLAGVSYRLLPMFLPAPPHPSRSGWVLGFGSAAIVSGVLMPALPLVPIAVPLLSLTAAGVFYLLDVSRYWRERRRRTPDGLLLLIGSSHLGLLAALVTIVLAVAGARPLLPAAVAVSVLGWYLLAWLGFSQRILPFIGWLHGMRGGRRDTPHVAELWPSWLGWMTSVGALAGSVGVLIGFLIRVVWTLQAGSLLLAASIVLFHGGGWRMLARVHRRAHR